MSQDSRPNLSEMDIPDHYLFRDYEYSLWKAYTDEGMARIEASGVRDGYAERMHGVNRAVVKRHRIDGVDVWCVYARYSSW